MTAIVIIGVTILTLVVLGYSFNQQDGKLEQGGLLQFASTPSGATITLDERELGSLTSTKATVFSGSHSVTFDREGYRTWRKTIDIKPGQIGWLNYARLIPIELKPRSVRTLPSVASALASPKKNYMIFNGAANQPVFELADIRSDTVRYTTIELPQESYTLPTVGTSHAFTFERWSDNENAVLIKHVYNGNATEWILLNRDEPEKSINITKTFAINPKKLLFAGSDGRLLFAQIGDVVRRIDLNELTLSRPLASGVADFAEYDDDTIVYTTTTDKDGVRTAGYATADSPTPQVLRTYTGKKQPLLIDMEVYFGKRYVSVLYGRTLTIDVGELPTANSKGDMERFATVTVPAGAKRLTMSDSGRFVTVELPDGYAIYDIELKKYDKVKWDKPAAVSKPLRWLDGYIIWSDNGGQLRLYEFDGANQQNIMPVVEGLAVSLSPNDKFIYGFTKTDDGIELRRVQLVL